ncbi:unnamed protein product [Amoebophrya sp. A120]|nr:unnamed protein product [Amoebophrya sp. A120]
MTLHHDSCYPPYAGTRFGAGTVATGSLQGRKRYHGKQPLSQIPFVPSSSPPCPVVPPPRERQRPQGVAGGAVEASNSTQTRQISMELPAVTSPVECSRLRSRSSADVLPHYESDIAQGRSTATLVSAGRRDTAFSRTSSTHEERLTRGARSASEGGFVGMNLACSDPGPRVATGQTTPLGSGDVSRPSSDADRDSRGSFPNSFNVPHYTTSEEGSVHFAMEVEEQGSSTLAADTATARTQLSRGLLCTPNFATEKGSEQGELVGATAEGVPPAALNFDSSDGPGSGGALISAQEIPKPAAASPSDVGAAGGGQVGDDYTPKEAAVADDQNQQAIEADFEAPAPEEERKIQLWYGNFARIPGKSSFWIVICDHLAKAVVVAISGTNYMAEVATNFVLECAPLTPAADATPQNDPSVRDVEQQRQSEEYVHVGMLGCAEQIADTFVREGFLDRIPDSYRLVFTGHSMGAGVASICSLLFRRRFGNRVRASFATRNPDADFAETATHFDAVVGSIESKGGDITAAKSLSPAHDVAASALSTATKENEPDAPASPLDGPQCSAPYDPLGRIQRRSWSCNDAELEVAAGVDTTTRGRAGPPCSPLHNNSRAAGNIPRSRSKDERMFDEDRLDSSSYGQLETLQHARRERIEMSALLICPPGWTMSPKLAAETRQYAVTVVASYDNIPRARPETLIRFREHMCYLLERVRLSKWKIFLINRYRCCRRRYEPQVQELCSLIKRSPYNRPAPAVMRKVRPGKNCVAEMKGAAVTTENEGYFPKNLVDGEKSDVVLGGTTARRRTCPTPLGDFTCHRPSRLHESVSTSTPVLDAFSFPPVTPCPVDHYEEYNNAGTDEAQRHRVLLPAAHNATTDHDLSCSHHSAQQLSSFGDRNGSVYVRKDEPGFHYRKLIRMRGSLFSDDGKGLINYPRHLYDGNYRDIFLPLATPGRVLQLRLTKRADQLDSWASSQTLKEGVFARSDHDRYPLQSEESRLFQELRGNLRRASAFASEIELQPERPTCSSTSGRQTSSSSGGRSRTGSRGRTREHPFSSSQQHGGGASLSSTKGRKTTYRGNHLQMSARGSTAHMPPSWRNRRNKRYTLRRAVRTTRKGKEMFSLPFDVAFGGHAMFSDSSCANVINSVSSSLSASARQTKQDDQSGRTRSKEVAAAATSCTSATTSSTSLKSGTSAGVLVKTNSSATTASKKPKRFRIRIETEPPLAGAVVYRKKKIALGELAQKRIRRLQSAHRSGREVSLFGGGGGGNRSDNYTSDNGMSKTMYSGIKNTGPPPTSLYQRDHSNAHQPVQYQTVGRDHATSHVPVEAAVNSDETAESRNIADAILGQMFFDKYSEDPVAHFLTRYTKISGSPVIQPAEEQAGRTSRDSRNTATAASRKVTAASARSTRGVSSSSGSCASNPAASRRVTEKGRTGESGGDVERRHNSKYNYNRRSFANSASSKGRETKDQNLQETMDGRTPISTQFRGQHRRSEKKYKTLSSPTEDVAGSLTTSGQVTKSQELELVPYTNMSRSKDAGAKGQLSSAMSRKDVDLLVVHGQPVASPCLFSVDTHDQNKTNASESKSAAILLQSSPTPSQESRLPEEAHASNVGDFADNLRASAGAPPQIILRDGKQELDLSQYSFKVVWVDPEREMSYCYSSHHAATSHLISSYRLCMQALRLQCLTMADSGLKDESLLEEGGIGGDQHVEENESGTSIAPEQLQHAAEAEHASGDGAAGSGFSVVQSKVSALFPNFSTPAPLLSLFNRSQPFIGVGADVGTKEEEGAAPAEEEITARDEQVEAAKPLQDNVPSEGEDIKQEPTIVESGAGATDEHHQLTCSNVSLLELAVPGPVPNSAKENEPETNHGDTTSATVDNGAAHGNCFSGGLSKRVTFGPSSSADELMIERAETFFVAPPTSSTDESLSLMKEGSTKMDEAGSA